MGGLILVLAAILIFQLADRDNRNPWLWAAGFVAATVALSQFSWLGGLGLYLAFVGTFIALIITKPIGRG